jgi:hypothetical protein
MEQGLDWEASTDLAVRDRIVGFCQAGEKNSSDKTAFSFVVILTVWLQLDSVTRSGEENICVGGEEYVVGREGTGIDIWGQILACAIIR